MWSSLYFEFIFLYFFRCRIVLYLTWYDDDLYMITQLIKIVLNDSNTAIESVTPISFTVPICEGAVTASFVGDYNSIIGFSGPDLIKVCQLDGSTQMLCPDLNIDGTPGAASIRLPTQVPQPQQTQHLLATQELEQ